VSLGANPSDSSPNLRYRADAKPNDPTVNGSLLRPPAGALCYAVTSEVMSNGQPGTK